MLTEQERNQIEKLLLKERQGVLELLEQFDAETQDLRDRSGELSLYDQHQADFASEAHEQEQNFMLTSREGRRLYNLDEALRRLYKEPERFGLCARCGRDIGFARLEVIPETDHCAECQALLEGDVDANPREADPHANPITPDQNAPATQTDRHE